MHDANDESVTIEALRELPSDAWLRVHRPTHVLRARSTLRAPIERAFDFFSRAENLERITPRDMAFEILTPLPIAMRAGTTIDYRLRLGPIPVRWRTEILTWTPPREFIDVSLRGPYAVWRHEHRFEARGEVTEMFDTVYYAAPFGPLGRVANALFVRRKLRHIFEYRRTAIAELFGAM